jgi:glycosyltransferase involved in cell wall biosynthesis
VPGVRKVIFNQNAYLTFRGYPAEGLRGPSPYSHPEVKAVFGVSDDNLDYLRYAFPNQRFFRMHYGIDPHFAPKWPKRKVIAYMPRKNAEEVVQVFNLLRLRGALAGWEPVAIHGMNEVQVARCLAESSLFFSFGYPEGSPLPPLEAMASGCVAIGYHGWGGREYFRPEFSFPVAVGDVLGFARTAEQVLLHAARDASFLEEKGRAAEAYVREYYSPEREQKDILAAWDAILSQCG